MTDSFDEDDGTQFTVKEDESLEIEELLEEPDEAARFTAAEAYNKLLMVMTSAGPYGLDPPRYWAQDPVEGLEDDGDLRDAIEAASRVA